MPGFGTMWVASTADAARPPVNVNCWAVLLVSSAVVLRFLFGCRTPFFVYSVLLFGDRGVLLSSAMVRLL